jgi:hypothetical protein
MNSSDIQVDATLDGRVEVELLAHDDGLSSSSTTRGSSCGLNVLSTCRRSAAGSATWNLFSRRASPARTLPRGSCSPPAPALPTCGARRDRRHEHRDRIRRRGGRPRARRVNVKARAATSTSGRRGGVNVQSASGDTDSAVRGLINVNTASGDVGSAQPTTT